MQKHKHIFKRQPWSNEIVCDICKEEQAYWHKTKTINELDHYFFKLIAIHLSVRNSDPRVGHKLENDVGYLLDITDPVMNKEHLAITLKLMTDCVADEQLIV